MRQVRFLLIDDSADDRTLAARELRRELPGLEIAEISDPETLEVELAQGNYDLVVTDYQLHWTDGVSILKRVKCHHPDVPVIMHTGSGSEEVAVEAMKAGLDDYVLKSSHRRSRLKAAVKRALGLAEQRRELRRAESQYKELFETVPMGLFRCLPNGDMLDGNGALATMLGLTRSALLSRKMFELHARPEEYASWRAVLERHGAVAFLKSEFRCAAGKTVWVEIHAKAMRDASTGEIYYEGSIEDVSERKAAEAERERLIAELKAALSKVKSLTGLLPICAGCKKIRDEQGRWNDLEPYIESHSEAEFTHGFCPECAQRLYPELMLELQKL
jgi:PAS domain S-box-containing protein